MPMERLYFLLERLYFLQSIVSLKPYIDRLTYRAYG